MRPRLSWSLLVLLVCTCDRAAPIATPPDATSTDPAPPARARPVTISIVGTNDLHGHLGALPILGGYLANLRRARADSGAVVLLDGGDMFQGTIESNLAEGAPVVRAYAALGYDAVAIGNHEFDYGPVGPDATAKRPGDDPRGALHARIAEAGFPFLSANLTLATGAAADLGAPAVMIERAGVTIGIIGGSTEQTPRTTIAANVADLAFTPLADAVAIQARRLRERGADLVVLTAHAGGKCTAFDDPAVTTSCAEDEEIMDVARALPPGLVDVIVGGHTHQAMAHQVHGIAIIESYALGVAFGRVDVVVDPTTGEIRSRTIHPPQRLCTAKDAGPEAGAAACAPGPYEGSAVVPDDAIAAIIATPLAEAKVLRDRPLGPTLLAEFEAARTRECALGNLFTDLMLAARPGHDVALMNGGGLRAPLPAGPLRYGALYEAFPFDNRFATVRMTAAELRAALAGVLAHDGSFFSIAGIHAEARCRAGALEVTLSRTKGRAIRDTDTIAILTTDFLATGGDGFFAGVQGRADAVTVEDGAPIREVLVDALGARGPRTIAPDEFLRSTAPRIAFPGARPVRCAP